MVELDSFGQVGVWVFAGGQRIATASAEVAGPYVNTTFEHHNPVTASRVTTNGHSSNRTAVRQERDPQTGPVPLEKPAGVNSRADWVQPMAFIGGDPSDFVQGVTLDGMPVTRSDLNRSLGNGSAVAGIFVGGMQVGQVDLSRYGSLGSYSFRLDFWRSRENNSNEPTGEYNEPRNASGIGDLYSTQSPQLLVL